MFIKSFVYSLIISLFLSLSVHADAFDDSHTAYKKGDYKTALKLLKPLAEQGDARAQLIIGALYQEGKGVPQDNKEAVKWYRLAAEQGNAVAQNHLGELYAIGEVVITNYAEAARLYNLSARQGNGKSMYSLAHMHREGKGVEEDKIYAYMWFALAHDAGNSSAKEEREELSEKMTTKELRIAQELSQKCLDSDYKKCESALPNFLHRKFNLSSEDKD